VLPARIDHQVGDGLNQALLVMLHPMEGCRDDRTDLINQVAAGDTDALQQLIVLNHARLASFVAAEMDANLRRAIDPEDVLQEAYVAAFQSIGECRFDSPAAFHVWLETIVRNRLREMGRYFRRDKRDIARRHTPPRLANTSYADLLGRLSGTGLTPSRIMAKDEACAAVISSLARLSDDQRRALQMRFFEGSSVPEVAAALGKSENAVCVLCHRALKELGRLMGSITLYMSKG
jgi:RNA polymerase sigma-70 factor, ECF subfamily